MTDPLYAHSKATNSNSVPAIDHSSDRGTLANLAAQLTFNLALLALVSSENTSATNSSGNLQTEGQAESDTITALSGNAQNGMGTTWDGTNTDDPGVCPGLQYFIAHGDTSDSHYSSDLQGIQANIADKRLAFDNATTAMQTVLDQLKDAVNSVGQGSTSWMNAITTGTMGVASNLNSIRIN